MSNLLTVKIFTNTPPKPGGLFFYVLFASTLLFSCKNKEKSLVPANALARVENSFLTSDDIKGLVPAGTTPQDSIELVKKYIDNWIHEVIIVKKAEANLSLEKLNVEQQLQSYKNSLITYAYEKELVKQKLDTAVNDKEIEDYYNTNQGNFELKDNIVKVRYIKILKKAPNLNKVKTWYVSEAPKDKEQLASYCHQYAESFYLDDETWLLFDDLLKVVPIQTYNKELFLQNSRYIEVQDSAYSYFVNIKGFKIKNSLSPLAFEKEKIKNIILNKRKLDLISKMKNDIYSEAEANKTFEVYVNKP